MAYMFSIKEKYNKYKKEYENYNGVLGNEDSPSNIALPHIHSFQSSNKLRCSVYSN